MSSTLFDGPQSLRVGREWRVLFLSVLAIIVAAPLLAYVFPILNSFKEIALLLIGGMIYVTFARGRLIGGSIRVHAGQFGHVYDIALECSRALRMNVPSVFVRDDPFVPIVAVGIGEPYSLIISAQWVDHLGPAELRFLIGRELAHIAAGHTRLTSLLSVNGRENAVVSILFGAWLRRIEYTADRVGLLCCASLDEALAAISVSTFHLIGRKIDLAVFAEQQREIEAERALRIGEWVSATPYATRRIAALCAFARDPAYLAWSLRIEENRSTPFVSAPLPAGAVSRRAYANFPRRLSAFFIDSILIGAIVPGSPVAVKVTSSSLDPNVPHWVVNLSKHVHAISAIDTGGWNTLVLLCYIVLLVGLAGQTFGMMIMDLRVVNARFGRIGLFGAVVRYACLLGSMVAVVGILKTFARIQPFEKWSKTRLISGSAHLSRVEPAITPQPLEPAASQDSRR